MQIRTYRVYTPMLGVCATTTPKPFVSIPPYAILVVNRDRNSDPLYVSVQWDSYELLVFPQDLAERTVECVISPKSAA